MVERFQRPSDDNNDNPPDQPDDVCRDVSEAIAAHPQVPPLSGLKKISPQLVEPFEVIERIGRLAYCLDLPDNMRIHSVAHLEPTTNPTHDQHHRHESPSLALPLLRSFMSPISLLSYVSSQTKSPTPLRSASLCRSWDYTKHDTLLTRQVMQTHMLFSVAVC